MATSEHEVLQIYQDENGNKYILYPITKAGLVEGLEEAIAQGIAGQGQTLVQHLNDKNNPHQVKADQVGAVAAANLGKPGSAPKLNAKGVLPIERGGTGANNAKDAKANLGISSTGGQSTFEKLITGRFI